MHLVTVQISQLTKISVIFKEMSSKYMQASFIEFVIQLSLYFSCCAVCVSTDQREACG